MATRKNNHETLKHNLKIFALSAGFFIYGLILYMAGHSNGYNRGLLYNQGYTAQQVQAPKYFTGQELFDAINAYRKGKGIGEVKLYDPLCDSLIERWQIMSDPTTFGHQDFQEWVDKYVPKGMTVTELGASGATTDELIQKWVDSPGHRLGLEDSKAIYACTYAAEGTGVVILGNF